MKNWKQRMLIAWLPWIVGGAVLGLASVKIGEAILAEEEKDQTACTYETQEGVPELWIIPELHIVEPENPDVHEVTP